MPMFVEEEEVHTFVNILCIYTLFQSLFQVYAFIFKGILISKLRINYVSSKLIELIDDLIKFDNF